MILERKYAQALYELVKNKSSDDINHIFSNFISLLKKRGHFSLLPKILKALKITKQKEDLNVIELKLVSENEKEKFKSKINEFKDYLGDDLTVKTSLDKTIIGGFVIKTKNILIDGSYKKALMNLYNKFRF